MLRQDNADLRLTERAYEIGLATQERWERLQQTKGELERERERLNTTFLTPKECNDFLQRMESSPLQNKVSLAELLKRPELSYELLGEIDKDRKPISQHAITQLEVQIKYDGYITKQLQQVERFKRLESRRLDKEFDYQQIDGLRVEARQKLSQLRPVSIGQASRISGVSPADINVLIIYLEKQRRKGK